MQYAKWMKDHPQHLDTMDFNWNYVLKLGIDITDWAYDFGWDSTYGGIFYFLDISKNFSPVSLEWSMKLWWPHTEAMISFSMAYSMTGNIKYWKKFVEVTRYTLKHFRDDKNGGEWFGYLNQEGKVTHRLKGGAYKGCFHLPRALWMCSKILEESSHL